MTNEAPPVTPDGRYIVVRGRLWRATNPKLTKAAQQRLTGQLMAARRKVGAAKTGSKEMKFARAAVDRAKRGLGERGPVWWRDGAKDYNRYLAKNTPYAEWFASLADSD